MRDRSGITLRGLLPIIGVISLVGGGLVYGCRPRMTFREVHRLVDENVSRGASSFAVLSFLDSRHLAHDDYDRLERLLWAHMYDVWPPLGWTPTDIHVCFRFDHEDRLTDYTVFVTERPMTM